MILEFTEIKDKIETIGSKVLKEKWDKLPANTKRHSEWKGVVRVFANGYHNQAYLSIKWYMFGYFLDDNTELSPDKRKCLNNQEVWKPIKQYLKENNLRLEKDEADSIEYYGTIYFPETKQLQLFLGD